MKNQYTKRNGFESVLRIEIGGLECAVYCFAFFSCVIPMESKDGTNTLAKDVCKQRTDSGMISALMLLAYREATKYREKVLCK